MIFEPRKLEVGWFGRCLKNAFFLSKRTPFVWLMIYGIPLLISEYLNAMPALMLIAGFVILAGLVLAFKTDTHSKKSVLEIVLPLISVAGYFAFGASAIWIVSWLSLHSVNAGFIPTVPGTFMIRFAYGFMFLLFSLMTIYAALKALFFPFHILGLVWEKMDFELHSIGIFSIQLTLDQGLSLGQLDF
ncbi:hypothetical protein ACO0LB_17945 [Undibacterium sp. SXout7W]|uniref:hypothetical protein n=1 Tax=Undibacterium sp. SXout7W TaxID=3413049 RepID=UPI003BF30214